MAAVEVPRPLQGHIAMPMEEGVVERTKVVEDLGEDELGIYEDNAECADLTDSEFEDIDWAQPTSTKPVVLGSMGEGITAIREEDEPASGESCHSGEHRLQLDNSFQRSSPERGTEEEMKKMPSVFMTDSEDTKLNLPSDLNENSLECLNSPESRHCPGVREQRDTAPPVGSVTQGDKSLVSFSNEEMKQGQRPESGSTADLQNLAALRGKANTPVSGLVDIQGGTESRQLDSR